MNIDAIRTFFMWCSLLNGGLLVFSALLCTFAGGWIYAVHGRWFSMPRETFNAVMYGFVGAYKILFITFNLIPYLALSLMK